MTSPTTEQYLSQVRNQSLQTWMDERRRLTIYYERAILFPGAGRSLLNFFLLLFLRFFLRGLVLNKIPFSLNFDLSSLRYQLPSLFSLGCFSSSYSRSIDLYTHRCRSRRGCQYPLSVIFTRLPTFTPAYNCTGALPFGPYFSVLELLIPVVNFSVPTILFSRLKSCCERHLSG